MLNVILEFPYNFPVKKDLEILMDLKENKDTALLILNENIEFIITLHFILLYFNFGANYCRLSVKKTFTDTGNSLTLEVKSRELCCRHN